MNLNMAILIDQNKRVMVREISGREGLSRTRLMLEYGTNIFNGCTPKRRGQKTHDLPVFNSINEARENRAGIEVSVITVKVR